MKIHPNPVTEFLSNDISFDMILVEGGVFSMGASDSEAMNREKPIHRVQVPGFYLGKYPVTQAVWQAVMGKNPSRFKGDQRPMERICWDDAQEFMRKLNAVTNKHYRLPTESEWEYAARGGILHQGEGYIYAGSEW